MRVLLVSAPLLGHVFPMMPLALALRAAKCDVLVATGGEALRVRDTGIAVADVAAKVRLRRYGLRLLLTHPLMAKTELAGGADLRFVSRLFAAANRRMLGAVLELADHWKPDIVVHEPLAAAGAVVAAARGVPAIVHDTSLFDGTTLTAATAEQMGHTLPPATVALRTAPPSVVDTGPGWRLRPVPYSGAGPVPDWLRQEPVRPRVLVSRSTVAGPGGGKLMAAVVTAAEHVDAEFVLVRPPTSLTQRTLPTNVRLVGWVPIPDVLPTCAALVHHGGAGTLLAALAAGVPQLIEPGPGDRTQHAQLVAARGAGLACSAKEVTAEMLTSLVTSPELRSAASQVRSEIAELPGPGVVAERITSSFVVA
ncbi:nucleotide disphospho-sugar-binding domain-containing protein [Saccharomonospora sp. NPDC046836]|uniref:nucleotide disphospho-sugar-binding domain-containing protein n=1 Tax=Saccharomonospora sp. NPDC046836 TaxID=3156921 RepID=UPI0033F0E20E